MPQPPPPLRFPRNGHGFTVQVFWDSDVGKWIEAASYALSHRRDDEIEAMIDESLLRTPGRYPIVVKNLGLADPANTRIGDGTSNTGWLIVNYR